MARYHASHRCSLAEALVSHPNDPSKQHPAGVWARLLSLPRQVLRGTLALLILFEEWGWEPLSRALAVLSRLPPVRWAEARILRLPPYGALGVFLLPSVLLVPVKLLALYLIGQGHAGTGLLVIVLAKLLGTALLARLFALTRDSLLQLAWFARLYLRWHTFKEGLLLSLRASPAWRAAQRLKRRLGWTLRRWRRGS